MTDDLFHGTTILSVRRGKRVALGGDGQVTHGNVVLKATARKVRRLYQDRVLAGFAGGTADAFTLFERFEAKLDQVGGQSRFGEAVHHGEAGRRAGVGGGDLKLVVGPKALDQRLRERRIVIDDQNASLGHGVLRPHRGAAAAMPMLGA